MNYVYYGFLINFKLIAMMCQNAETVKSNSFQEHQVLVPKIVLMAIQENCFCIYKLNKNFIISNPILPKK